MTVREDFIEAARGVVGVGEGEGRARYEQLVAGGETPERAAELVRLSGCGLVVRGLLRELGVTDPRVLAPYRVGRVVSDLVQMSREAGAWATHYYELTPGDVLVFGAPEHVAILEEVVEGQGVGDMLHTIDGGQRDAHGLETIARRARPLHGARPLVGRIDLGAFAKHFMPEMG